MSEKLPLFVYGTLRPGRRNHHRYLGAHAVAARPAALPGAALHAGPGFPYALPDPGRTVLGDLITVRPAAHAQVLAALDRLEECRPEGDGLYVRERLAVTALDTGERLDAWVYLAGPAVAAELAAHPALIESGDWTAA
ncbi:gamma-glutamylcyclotransferase family protein [Kitasatospora sp. NPDC058965]|uniref:gamma-glutamylcyclotransferase family protein n=1 Tax=Kitasatospora sp. NPDC058965 TaxID=3346682 RepID=UPI003685A6A2